jgi:hypothetical protein
VDSKEELFFKKYFPPESILYCHQLWKHYKIQLTVSQPRKSIFGNYRYQNGIHHISVNGNLKPEAFLVTYLHEVAHLEVMEKYGNKAKPHGSEWQASFQALLRPMIENGIFSQEVALALWNHIQNPKATSCSDPDLHLLLTDGHKVGHEDEFMVSHLPIGSRFVFEGRTFLLKSKERTSFHCLELNSERMYRFKGFAKVRRLESSNTEPAKGPKTIPIHHIGQNENFRLGGRQFKMIAKRRTKFLVLEVPGNQEYLINQDAMVELIKP